MSSLNVEDDQRWVPTHVQVTVLRGRGLRAKGKHGTSDVYTIIQVGKEKYSTCVLEKTTTPEWKEECSFELLPGVLEPDDGDGSAYPPGSSDLVLTVMHRAVMGLDVFLGQAVIPLNKLFQDRICMKNEWCKLNSKTGKKEKERGDIQVTVQFTKNNLTASMYDLSLGKDKPRSTFGKIKDRIKGKKRIGKGSEEDLPSVIIGGYGPVSRMRNRLPSDGGGEEDYEDDEGGEGRRSKMRNFFLRGKLRKSSDTRSSTSLGSESSESSSRGGSLSPTAGISVVVSDLSNSPSNSSNFTADSPDHTTEFSPKLASYPCEFTDESGEITIPVPQPVCINGSHVYNVAPRPPEPGPGNPVVALVKKRLPLSQSLQNLSQQKEELPVPLPRGGAADGRRWSFDKAGKDEREAIAVVLMQAGQGMGEGGEGEGSDGDSQGRKRGRTCQEELSEQASGSGPGNDKHKGWFRSKDSHNRPSPHPVRPLTPEEKRRAERSEGRSVLDKLKSSIHPGRSSQSTEQVPERKKSLTEGAGSYYHLTHSELVALLLQREADLHRQRAEFDRQGAMLAKREAELKKIKPQVRDLEDYIDTLLVRIMEQTPTILQVRSKLQ
ncbi:rab11 family-interacting protein 5 isoform X2 [Esox lucius]|uniref:rab11 family-interacting protein 5 isoform X2 n=1 Tax=Esox lucius TaxID=8010 RepID=UPI000661B5E1|nr:rab11 family-interacting protein 5 isoform X2 [Esox lucius]